MMSWWKAKKKRRLEAEFRRNTIRLHEGHFLHGELEVDVQEARDLPDTDNFMCNIKNCVGHEKDVTDPYVAVCLDNTRIITTSIIYNNLCPQWNEFFRVSVCHYAKKLVFRVKDQDELGTDAVGEVCIPVQELLREPKKSQFQISGWHDIIDAQNNQQGQLFIKIKYKPYEDNHGETELPCPDTYFPLRKGNRVTLYSCARNNTNNLPSPKGDSGTVNDYVAPSLWLDLYRSLVAATNFIYITGWSVYTDMKLLRGDDHQLLKTEEELLSASLSLGELLKKKAEDGVRVLIMIWGETTSIMGTHDTETENFFKGTRVFVARVGRQTKTREYKDLEAHFTAHLGYSHHQKAVIVDAPIDHQPSYCDSTAGEERLKPGQDDEKSHPPNGSMLQNGNQNGKDPQHSSESNIGNGSPSSSPRRIIAFVGGIDLTDGRYDTPQHSLFQSLVNEHSDDFYQPCEPSIKAIHGPRMPWQDIHARVEGRAARDIMINFVERWGKERPLNTRLLIQNVGLPTHDIDCVPGLEGNEGTSSDKLGSNEEAPWEVQVFRSITSDSARFELENETSFTTKKGRSVDNSIMRAYTWAIRRAKRHIYIENQYFMGSAHGWLDDQDVHCYNVIPMEIVQQICEAIREGRRFTVYIVIPMHPEGVATDSAIQEMLFWQKHTMHMMYARVAQAIHSAGKNYHPTEYLMFFCLGKKEAIEDIPAQLAKPPRFSAAAKLRKVRRHMIYVHSKLMVVDDAYVITGSANINQRSLDGDRDSELAIGAYQPKHLCRDYRDSSPKGEVHKFRLNLFKEHLGYSDPVFTDPGTEACARTVREAALQNWANYITPLTNSKHQSEHQELPRGHLLAYPIDVAVNLHDNFPIVTLHARTKRGRFPDSKAKILGRAAKSIPNKLTT